MIGMDAHTGKRLSGRAHLAQSIRDILTTPIGSRVMRRDYGSHIFELIDQPGNPATLLQVYAAGIDALLRWEPRIVPTRIQAATGTDLAQGRFALEIDGTAVDLEGAEPGESLQLTVPLQ